MLSEIISGLIPESTSGDLAEALLGKAVASVGQVTGERGKESGRRRAVGGRRARGWLSGRAGIGGICIPGSGHAMGAPTCACGHCGIVQTSGGSRPRLEDGESLGSGGARMAAGSARATVGIARFRLVCWTRAEPGLAGGRGWPYVSYGRASEWKECGACRPGCWLAVVECVLVDAGVLQAETAGAVDGSRLDGWAGVRPCAAARAVEKVCATFCLPAAGFWWCWAG